MDLESRRSDSSEVSGLDAYEDSGGFNRNREPREGVGLGKIMSSVINKGTRGYSWGDSFFLCFIEM